MMYTVRHTDQIYVTVGGSQNSSVRKGFSILCDSIYDVRAYFRARTGLMDFSVAACHVYISSLFLVSCGAEYNAILWVFTLPVLPTS